MARMHSIVGMIAMAVGTSACASASPGGNDDTTSGTTGDSTGETTGESTGETVGDTTADSTGGPITVDLVGGIHKGPFVLGSMVSIIALDADGSPTGAVFETVTTSDRGDFSVSLTGVSIAEVVTQGFYFNEATATLSQAPIGLRAIAVPEDLEGSLYVNVLTHMAYPRAKAAIVAGTPAAEAIAEAESAVRAALGLFEPESLAAASQLDLLGGDDDGNAYLLALSCTLAEAGVAASDGAAPDAAMQELVNTIAATLETQDSLMPESAEQLATGRRRMNGTACMAALEDRLAAIGDLETVVPNVYRVLDFDGDGVVDALDDDVDGDGELSATDTVALASPRYMLDTGGSLWVTDVVDDPDLFCGDGRCRFEPDGLAFVDGATEPGGSVAVLGDDGSVWREREQLEVGSSTITRVLSIARETGTVAALDDAETVVLLGDGEPIPMPELGPVADAALSGLDSIGWIDPDGAAWFSPIEAPAPSMPMFGSAEMVDLIGDANPDGGVYYLDADGTVWFADGFNVSEVDTGVESLVVAGTIFVWTGTELRRPSTADGTLEPGFDLDAPLFHAYDGADDVIDVLYLRTTDGDLGTMRSDAVDELEVFAVPR